MGDAGKQRRHIAEPRIDGKAGGEQQQRIGEGGHGDGSLGRPRWRVNR